MPAASWAVTEALTEVAPESTSADTAILKLPSAATAPVKVLAPTVRVTTSPASNAPVTEPVTVTLAWFVWSAAVISLPAPTALMAICGKASAIYWLPEEVLDAVVSVEPVVPLAAPLVSVGVELLA